MSVQTYPPAENPLPCRNQETNLQSNNAYPKPEEISK